MTDMAPETNGNRVTLRDVYTAIGESETRMLGRMDRLEASIERLGEQHSGRLDGLCTRVDTLERRAAIEDTRVHDIRTGLGDARTVALFALAISAFAISLMDFTR